MIKSAKSALTKNLEEKRTPNLSEEWKMLLMKINKFRSDLRKPRSSLAFSFVEVRESADRVFCNQLEPLVVMTITNYGL